jgi:peptidyl-prolyl cis-trans isomerase B (cyclophilin B)
VPTDKQRRDAARRRLARQLTERQAQEARRRRFTLIASIIGGIVIAAIVVVFVVATTNDDKKHPAADNPTVASPSATASPSSTPSPSTTVVTEGRTGGGCGYTEAPSTNTDLKNVGVPPDPKKTPTTDRVLTLDTNRGTIKIRLNATLAPCNVQSIAYLAAKGFFNHTSCHRLVTTGIYVLQCGDPTGTGAGGPTYSVKDENLGQADYVQGAVAMANAGPDTNGSQFFIMTKDSNAGLAKSYTEIGTVTEGMNIVEAVAAGGSNNANGAGDGKPKLTLTFTTVTAAPPVTGRGTPTSVDVTETVTPSAAPTS